MFAQVIAAEQDVKPFPGESLLSAADADKLLTELLVFKDKSCLKAQMVTEVDDLLGARKDEGELLLDRSGRVLRKFTKPSLKVWLLDGSQIQEYSANRKMLYVKDFKQAPKALKLIQAAFTGNVKELNELFDLHVFRSTKENQNSFRFLLLKKEKADAMLYKRIDAQVLENGLFFHQIEYLPESGDRVIERYLNITATPKPSDQDFALEVPEGVQRKTELIGTGAEK
jgi:outer membrane lipoprotein-sorting protein